MLLRFLNLVDKSIAIHRLQAGLSAYLPFRFLIQSFSHYTLLYHYFYTNTFAISILFIKVTEYSEGDLYDYKTSRIDANQVFVQIVSQYSSTLAPIAVSAVTRLATATSSNVDLRDVRIVKKVGGTIEDTELVDGVVLNQNVVVSGGGPTRIEKAKIGLIQFQLSAPKPDVRVLLILGINSLITQTYHVYIDGQYRHRE